MNKPDAQTQKSDDQIGYTQQCMSDEEGKRLDEGIEAFREKYGREPNGMERFLLVAKARGLA